MDNNDALIQDSDDDAYTHKKTQRQLDEEYEIQRKKELLKELNPLRKEAIKEIKTTLNLNPELQKVVN